MSDIKSVLSLLCQHLSSSIDVQIKPEYFRLAKFNETAENVTRTLWRSIEILSFLAVSEKETDADFRDFDTLSATKLCFAFLQYPATEFYGLTETSDSNRELLIAFAWLLGTQNVLSTAVRAKLADSALGQECSPSEVSVNKEFYTELPNSLIGQINNILHLNGKVNYNIKEISELLSEKTKLIDKVHAASRNVSGLPHLSVSELALMKRVSTAKVGQSDEDKKRLQDLSNVGSLIDAHMRWTKKEHIFFDWMVTVLEEKNKSVGDELNNINWEEVAQFISLLRRVINERVEALSSNENPSYRDSEANCVSRFLRTQDGETEVENWLTEANLRLARETEELSRKKKELAKELKELLRSIPSCVQV